MGQNIQVVPGPTAVIGAGPAGLAAAWQLVRSGVRVTIYEATDRAGGALRTDEVDGAKVDVGVQLVSSTYTSLFELAREAGAAGLLHKAPGRDALWRRDRAHSITYGSVSSMVLSAALPTTLKLRLGAKYLPFLTTQVRHLDANDLTGSGGAAHDRESIAAWGQRELGDDFVELLVYPLLAAYYGAAPEETSAAVYHALARVGMDVSVFACSGGFGALAQAIVARLQASGAELRTATAVDRVHASDAGVELEIGGERVPFDAVILAVPPKAALRLLPDSAPPALRTFLSSVRDRSTLTVTYRTERPFPGDFFGLSFPRSSRIGKRVAAVCVQRQKLAGLVPPGGDALVVMPAPAMLDELWQGSDEDVARFLLKAIEEAVSGVTRRVTASQVTRFEHGSTLFTPGYITRLSAFDAKWLPPRVGLAGDYLVAPTVEGAVRSGAQAAARLWSARAPG